MSHTLFISDLHLTAERPHINQQFFAFAEQVAPKAEALYILGDLFEYWAGDDDTEDSLNTGVSAALAKLAVGGVRVYLMHGNRDLLRPICGIRAGDRQARAGRVRQRHMRHAAGAKERFFPCKGAVNILIYNDKITGDIVFAQASYGGNCHQIGHAKAL